MVARLIKGLYCKVAIERIPSAVTYNLEPSVNGSGKMVVLSFLS
jgi:hypothetical protein